MSKILLILMTLFLSLQGSLTLSQMKKEPRIALVVANENYVKTKVSGVISDGQYLKNFLSRRGFKVIYVEDASRGTLVKAIRDFSNGIKAQGVALFYYNGLVYQFKNKNFLVTSDAFITNEYELQDKVIDVDKIFTKMAKKNARLNLVLLDGARNVKLHGTFEPSKKGLASITLPSSWQLFLSVKPNRTTRKSMFTSEFINTYKSKGITLQAGKVKLPYVALTKGDDFYFSLPSTLKNIPLEAYKKAQKTGTVSAYQSFLSVYANSSYAPQAHRNIKKLKTVQAKQAAEIIQKKKALKAQKLVQQKNEEIRAKEKVRRDALAALKKRGIRVYEPEMVRIKMGSFKMGGDLPQNTPMHKENITYNLEVAKYEVTNKAYNQYLKAIEKKVEEPSHFMDKDQPAINISWYAARNYAKWLRKYTGKNYRLPTEAEWEYFARAGESGVYIWGNEIVEVVKYAWMKRSAGGLTHEYGLRRSNNWGIFDVFGNVTEWCEDDYLEGYYKTKGNGRAIKNDNAEEKVHRGGSWKSDVAELSSAHRGHNVPDYSDKSTGFRLVLGP